MFLADCPNCRKPILIPGNHMKAVAQCPLCEYEFSVEGIAASEVPVAEILRSDFSTLDGESNEASTQDVKPLNFDLDDGDSANTGQLAPGELNVDTEVDQMFKSDQARPNFDFVNDADRSADSADSAVTQSVPSPFIGSAGEASVPSQKTSVASDRSNTARRGRSPLFEIVKVLGGGIAGLAIAQLILWWLPGTWRRDPLSLAPKLPSYAAFAAPESLRFPNRNPNIPTNDPNQTSPNRDSDSEPIEPNDFAIDLGNAGLNQDIATDPDDSAPQHDATIENPAEPIATAGDDPSQDETGKEDDKTAPISPTETGNSDEQLATNDNASQVAANDPPRVTPVENGDGANDNDLTESSLNARTDNPPTDDSQTEPETNSDDNAPDPEAEPKYVGLVDAPKVSVDDFNESFDTASALTAALSPDSKHRQSTVARQEFYIRVAKLGRAATYMEIVENHPDALSKVESLLTTIGGDRFKFNLIGASVSGWLEYKGRDTEGVVVAGYARSVKSLGDLFVTEVELAGKPDRFMNVLSKTDPRQDKRMPVTKDSPLIILGIIADKPSEQIAGYETEATVVIWQGVHTTLKPRGSE